MKGLGFVGSGFRMHSARPWAAKGFGNSSCIAG